MHDGVSIVGLSSVYYIAEIEGGERIIVTNSRKSLRANMRFGSDRAIRVRSPDRRWLLVQEPLSILNPEHCAIISYSVNWGRSRRNRAA